MSLVLKDRVLETSISTGTGNFSLAGAQTGYQGFSVAGDGATVPYTIQGKNPDGSLNGEWEVGIGTYHSAGNYVSRDTVLESSNGNALVMFSAGDKDIFLDMPGENIITTAGAGLSISGNTITNTSPAIWPVTNTTGASGPTNVAIGSDSFASNVTGDFNVAIGSRTLQNNTAGNTNVAIGNAALTNNTGSSASDNIAIGSSALYNNDNGYGNIALGLNTLSNSNSGNYNLAMQVGALQSNTTGSSNVALGPDALNNNSTGSENVAIGDSALYSNTTGSYNVALGNGALSSSSGDFNIGIGYNALASNTANGNIGVGLYALNAITSGGDNLAIGSSAMQTNTVGERSIAIGSSALLSSSTGTENVAIGYSTLRDNTDGSGNLALGNYAGYRETNSNTFYIDNQDRGTYANGVSNSLIYGTFDADPSLQTIRLNGNVSVYGAYTFPITDGTSGYVLTTDGSGTVTWQAGGGGASWPVANTSGSTGPNNVAIGYNSFNTGTGGAEVAIGEYTLTNNTFGLYNTAIGSYALSSNTTGDNNVAVGRDCLAANGTGQNNVAMGFRNLYYATTGSWNVALGNYAGQYETGSYAFYLDNFARASSADEKAGALIYGTFDSLFSNQTLRLNANVSIAGAYTLPITDGTSGYVLTTDGAGTVTWQAGGGGGGSGTVTSIATGTGLTGGPITTSGTIDFSNANVATWAATPSSANLAAAVTDETGSGSLVFGTNPTLSSPNIDVVDFDTTYTTPLTAGQLGWDGNNTLAVGMAGGNVTQHIGEDLYFYIKATSAITKGQVVMFTGAVGASGVPTGAPASGVTDGSYIMGVAAESIALNGFGLVQSYGEIRNVNTSGYADGDILWYDPSVAGGLTKTKPSAPNIKVQMAAVINGGSSGGGTILVRVSAGSVLGGTDANVQFGTLANGNLIQYDSALGYWKNVTTISNTSVSGLGTMSTQDASNVAITGGTIGTETVSAVSQAATFSKLNLMGF